MTGCPGKELIGKKIKVAFGEEKASILDKNDFGDLSKVSLSAIGQSKKRELIDEVKVKTTTYNGEDDFKAGDLKVTEVSKTIGAPEKVKDDGDKKKVEVEKQVKMEPFTPNLNNLSSFIVQVPSQSLEARRREEGKSFSPSPFAGGVGPVPTINWIHQGNPRYCQGALTLSPEC